MSKEIIDRFNKEVDEIYEKYEQDFKQIDQKINDEIHDVAAKGAKRKREILSQKEAELEQLDFEEKDKLLSKIRKELLVNDQQVLKNAKRVKVKIYIKEIELLDKRNQRLIELIQKYEGDTQLIEKNVKVSEVLSEKKKGYISEYLEMEDKLIDKYIEELEKNPDSLRDNITKNYKLNSSNNLTNFTELMKNANKEYITRLEINESLFDFEEESNVIEETIINNPINEEIVELTRKIQQEELSPKSEQEIHKYNNIDKQEKVKSRKMIWFLIVVLLIFIIGTILYYFI